MKIVAHLKGANAQREHAAYVLKAAAIFLSRMYSQTPIGYICNIYIYISRTAAEYSGTRECVLPSAENAIAGSRNN